MELGQTNRFQHFPDLQYGKCVGLGKPVTIGGPDDLRPRTELQDLAHRFRLAVLADEGEYLTNVLPSVCSQWNPSQKFCVGRNG